MTTSFAYNADMYNRKIVKTYKQ